MQARILVVDDEEVARRLLQQSLESQGYAVAAVADGQAALERLVDSSFDLLITDLCMEGVDGLALLTRVREVHPGLAVIIVTGYASVDSAVDAMHAGAFDYLRKPFLLDELYVTVERALAYERALRENRQLRDVWRRRYHFANLVGDAPAMRQLYSDIVAAAQTPDPVLIIGESGTGKCLVARAVHSAGPRSSAPFAEVNCVALPEANLRRRLFGDAKSGAKGLLGQTEQGTIHLVEPGLLPASCQTELTAMLAADQCASGRLRLLASSIEPLADAVTRGALHADLAARLSPRALVVPPLRQRLTDIPLLVQHFLDRFNARQTSKIAIENTILLAMQDYSWPGNVRELENAVMRAAEACRSGCVSMSDLSPSIRTSLEAAMPSIRVPEGLYCGRSLRNFLEEQEREYINYIMRLTKGDREKGAELLGISATALEQKWEKLARETH